MVPYLAQGAAQAIEDGAALAECLERAKAPEDLPKLLKAFEAIRKPRCEKVQEGARQNGNNWHMPDGPEQEQRDKAMKQESYAEHRERVQEDSTEAVHDANPNIWSDEDFQPWLFGHNVFEYTNHMLDEMKL